MKSREDTLFGVLLGTAVGDALGLHREGLTASRARRLYGGAPLSYRLIGSYGMVSDDTEHTCLVAQSLLSSGGDVERFSSSFGWRLRGWLAALPVGLGLGTLRAVLRLWVGFSPKKSGVFTAGNGPAMRAAILGVCFAKDSVKRKQLVEACTKITHTDPKAYEGALCIALAAAEASLSSAIDPMQLIERLRQEVQGEELSASLGVVRDHLQRGATVNELTSALKIEGFVSGYINHTVPVALFCWLRERQDLRAAVESGVLAGGDSDTVGAIVGALSGASLGASAIPEVLVSHLIEWPRGRSWMRELARRLALQFPLEGEATPQRAPLVLWPLVLLRNLFFFPWVFLYGVRRLLPPYEPGARQE